MEMLSRLIKVLLLFFGGMFSTSLSLLPLRLCLSSLRSSLAAVSPGVDCAHEAVGQLSSGWNSHGLLRLVKNCRKDNRELKECNMAGGIGRC